MSRISQAAKVNYNLYFYFFLFEFKCIFYLHLGYFGRKWSTKIKNNVHDKKYKLQVHQKI